MVDPAYENLVKNERTYSVLDVITKLLLASSTSSAAVLVTYEPPEDSARASSRLHKVLDALEKKLTNVA